MDYIIVIVLTVGVCIWWFKGNLKPLFDGWKTTAFNKIKGWFA